MTTRRFPRPRAYAPDPDAPGRTCDMPGCCAAGEYRAPKSRERLRDYWWFCLEHVRAYNAAWDFYKGMSPAQIEAEMRADVSWQRPSWPLGHIGARLDEAMARNPLHVLNAGLGGRRRVEQAKAWQADEGAPADLREPLATLGLSWPLTLEALKARYKQLAKRHHPDANRGDPQAEERIKSINSAYAALRERLARQREPLAAAG
jgi:DnaJ-domain-containing protein 1